MGVACLEFRGENFRGWRKNREIRESFLPRKFPAIRYQVEAGYTELHAIPLPYVYSALQTRPQPRPPYSRYRLSIKGGRLMMIYTTRHSFTWMVIS